MARDPILDEMVRRKAAEKSPAVLAATASAVEAMEEVAGRSDNQMSAPAVSAASPQIAQAVAEAVAATPEMQNVLNTERHFWLKRSFWAQVGAAAAGLMSFATFAIQYMQQHTSEDGTQSISVLGFAFAAWSWYSAFRAGRATVPLGSKPTRLPFPLNRG